MLNLLENFNFGLNHLFFANTLVLIDYFDGHFSARQAIDCFFYFGESTATIFDGLALDRCTQNAFKNDRTFPAFLSVQIGPIILAWSLMPFTYSCFLFTIDNCVYNHGLYVKSINDKVLCLSMKMKKKQDALPEMI
jgi:hypothetical protein